MSEPRITFTVFCPTCGNYDVPADRLVGILINRKASLASDILTARATLRRMDPKADAVAILGLRVKLQRLEGELRELGGEIFEGAR